VATGERLAVSREAFPRRMSAVSGLLSGDRGSGQVPRVCSQPGVRAPPASSTPLARRLRIIRRTSGTPPPR